MSTFWIKYNILLKSEMLQAASLVHLLSKEDKVVVSMASSEPLVLALIKALEFVFFVFIIAINFQF